MSINNIKYIITLCIILIAPYCYSQHLNFQDLQILYNGNTDENSTILYDRGFVYSNSKKNPDKSEQITWMFKKPDSNSLNEYFFKNCSSLFSNKCEKIIYTTSSEKHFISLKKSMQTGINKYLTSKTNENGVLSLYYMIPGPLIAKFSTIPLNPRVFSVELEFMEITDSK
ncbi:hypothetical protein [Aquirufa sp.]|jgi:hypothetical protein|uniref:hypothetical protein n=1 Tax=Aquirufa sp. TaxID=2676249 RepID=UPI0037BF2ACD